MALDYVMYNSLENKFVIFSDSLSVLKSLNHTSSKIPKIQNVIEKHHELAKTKEILFCWLPSHVGIKGNEAADVKAKASLDLEISNFKLPCTDFKLFINRYILFKWQLSWDRATFSKLHEIKPVLGKNTIYRSLRREEVVLTPLRIGHTRLAHSYPMGMVGIACLPSNAYYPRTPDYTLCSGVHVCWSEHSDSSFVYGFMILNYGFGTMTATTTQTRRSAILYQL